MGYYFFLSLIQNQKKNGEEYLQWLNISAVKDESGEPIRYVGTFTDITDYDEENNF